MNWKLFLYDNYLYNALEFSKCFHIGHPISPGDSYVSYYVSISSFIPLRKLRNREIEYSMILFIWLLQCTAVLSPGCPLESPRVLKIPMSVLHNRPNNQNSLDGTRIRNSAVQPKLRTGSLDQVPPFPKYSFIDLLIHPWFYSLSQIGNAL